ncbi:MAG: hypothetical protein ABR538_17140 [Candidatus Binatia bacterium]
MKHPFQTLIASAAAAAIVFAAGTASADPVKCHAAIGKNIAKYQATIAKNMAGCHKKRTPNKGVGVGVNCNLAKGANSSDIKLKVSGARTKVASAIAKACVIDAVPEATVLALYAACPSPVATSPERPTSQIDDFNELANCLLDLSEHYVGEISSELLGSPATIPASDGAIDCQGDVGKALSKAIKAIAGDRNKCHGSVEKTAAGLVPYTGSSCTTSDPKGKIAKATTALQTAINESCTTALVGNRAAWQALGNCAARAENPGAADLLACGYTKVANPIANGLAGAAQELPAASCAGVADVVINSGYAPYDGTVDKLTNSRLDSGWKGSAHNVDIIGDSLGAVSLSGCDADCKNCDVTHNSKNGNCRCETTIPVLPNPANAALIECDTINGPDAACGGGICQCMFGPPLPISASATPVCVVNRFAQQFTGGTQEVGEYSVGTTTRALVHTGISQVQPCPICVSGTCEGGARDGGACTVDASHPDFGDVSFDCPPDPGAGISGSGLLLDLSFTSGSSSVSALIPAAGTFCDGADDCHCSVCTGDSKIGCSNDAPCIAASAGTCGVPLANNPKQNDCDSSCSNDGNGNGECDGPIENFCDGFLRGNGNGVITCTSDIDCDNNDCNGDTNLTENECGDCLFPGIRQCFLPTVSATGTPGIFNSEGVSVFCSGQTGNAGVDNAGGLPGPGRVKLDFDFNLYCDNGTTPYQLPGGPTCP